MLYSFRAGNLPYNQKTSRQLKIYHVRWNGSLGWAAPHGFSMEKRVGFLFASNDLRKREARKGVSSTRHSELLVQWGKGYGRCEGLQGTGCLNSSGHMSFMTENLIGTEAERMSLVKKGATAYIGCHAARNFRVAIRQNFRKEGFGRTKAPSCSGRLRQKPKRTVKSMPLLQASPEDQIVPKYYLPRTNFQEMMGIGEPQFVTMGGWFYQVIMLVGCLW